MIRVEAFQTSRPVRVGAALAIVFLAALILAQLLTRVDHTSRFAPGNPPIRQDMIGLREA